MDKRLIKNILIMLSFLSSFFLFFMAFYHSKSVLNDSYILIKIGIIIFFAALFLVAPFIYLLYKYIKNLNMSNNRLLSINKKIETIFDNTSDAIIVIDKNGIIKELNSSVTKIFGYAKDELLNSNINIVVPNPHKQKHNDYIKNSDKSVHAKIINQNRDIYAMHKKGYLIAINLVVTKVEIDDEIFFIGNIRDLTQESKSKRLFESVFDSSPVGLALILKDGSYWRISNKFCSIVGYKREELMKLTFKDITHKDDLQKDLQYINRVLNKELDSYTLQKRYIRKDKKIVWVKLTVLAVYLDRDKRELEYLISTIDDITQMKELEIEKNKKEHMLMQQSKVASMGEMTSAIAHQWRQPLNSIGFIIQDLISAYKHNEFNEEYLFSAKKEIMEQLNYMSETIDEFRKFFKKDEPKIKFNILDAILDINRLYKAQLDSNRIFLEIEVNGKSIKEVNEIEAQELIINNQEGQLKQVVLNCVSNAKDAILDLEKRDNVQNCIYIEIKRLDEKIAISINDYAGGVDKKNINRIFEPYFTTKEMGTGLGLYICKSICEESLKGSLEYKPNSLNKDGVEYHGSTFIIYLNR